MKIPLDLVLDHILAFYEADNRFRLAALCLNEEIIAIGAVQFSPQQPNAFIRLIAGGEIQLSSLGQLTLRVIEPAITLDLKKIEADKPGSFQFHLTLNQPPPPHLFS